MSWLYTVSANATKRIKQIIGKSFWFLVFKHFDVGISYDQLEIRVVIFLTFLIS